MLCFSGNQDSIQSTVKQGVPLLLFLTLVTNLLGQCYSRTLIPIKEQDTYVPYGVYAIRNKWGCELKDPRCDLNLVLLPDTSSFGSITPEVPVAPEISLSRELPSSWEIIPFDGGLYQIISKQGCDEEPSEEFCNAVLSHRNGIAVLDKDYPAFWKIEKDGDSGFWQIRSDSSGRRKNHSLSFGVDIVKPVIELLADDNILWDLLLDVEFVDSQSMEDVKFDVAGTEVMEWRNTTLTSDEVHNLGQEDTVNTFGLEYPLRESFKFFDWDGFVVPMDTEMSLNKPIYDGVKLELSDTVSFTAKWRKIVNRVSQAVRQEEVVVPAATYKMVQVTGTEADFSVPFNALLRQTFKTGKFSTQQVRGMYYATQVFRIEVTFGDPMPLHPLSWVPDAVDTPAGEKIVNNTREVGEEAKILPGGFLNLDANELLANTTANITGAN